MESCELPSLRCTTHLVNGRSINVVRDDILEAGTKERGVDFFHDIGNEEDNVVAVAAISGYGQLAIAKMAQTVGLNCYIVVPSKSFRSNILVDNSVDKGAHYIKVSRFNDLLHYFDPIDRMKISIPTGYPGEENSTYVSNGLMHKVAEDFAQRHPHTYAMGLGLDDPQFIDAIAHSIRENNFNNINPRRMWVAVGSGTLVKALAKVWPRTEFMCVQVGRDIEDAVKDVPYAHIRVAPYKFFEPVTDPKLLPPFDSLVNYDAKVWQFILEEGEEDDYFWNVAGNMTSTEDMRR